jgi:hypothetical protein
MWLCVQADPQLYVCDLTVHRLVLGSVLLASKAYEDDVYKNNYYAKAGAVGKGGSGWCLCCSLDRHPSRELLLLVAV